MRSVSTCPQSHSIAAVRMSFDLPTFSQLDTAGMFTIRFVIMRQMITFVAKAVLAEASAAQNSVEC